jgi:3-methyladenine DNA glycosylase AlkD
MMAMAPAPAPPSSATARARELVADRKPAALELGRRAGADIADPAVVVATLASGLAELADPDYLEGQQRVAPGIGPVLGVRSPLLGAVSRGLRAVTRRDSSSAVLDVADHLVRQSPLELHWLAFDLLDRTIVRDPERTWQLVRAEARTAGDWITVDSLAHVAGRGILSEPYRWAELEQLVYSPSRWERRLVGSTIATIPYVDRTAGREPEIARHGLRILGDLIGDADPEVQKSVSWALRSLTLVDADATRGFLEQQAAIATTTDDGHRAWVVRDSLEKLPPDVGATLRSAVSGIRKRPRAASTSRAAATAAAFNSLGVDVSPAERPIIDRS